MNILKIYLFLLLLFISNTIFSETLDDDLFINFKTNYCINNQYNCKFDGSISPYSIHDYLNQKYKFIELFFAENGFESAAFEYCGSRYYIASLPVSHKQNDSIKSRNGCINFSYIKDSNIKSLIEERRGLFYSPDKSIYSYTEAMPGYIFTIGYPRDFYSGTGEGYNNLGVHFFINLNNELDLDKYCLNKSPIKKNQLPSELREILLKESLNEIIPKIKKNYNIFYRLYLKDIANFMPSKSSLFVAECIYVKKKSIRNRYIFNGKNII